MIKNLFYPSIIVLLGVIGTLFVQNYNKNQSLIETEVRVTHEQINLEGKGLFKLVSKYVPVQKGPEKQVDSLKKDYLEILQDSNITKMRIIHKYVVDTKNPEIVDKVSIVRNKFDYLVMVKQGIVSVLEKHQQIDFALEFDREVVFFGFLNEYFLTGEKGIVLTYKNKEIPELDLYKHREIELKEKSWLKEYPMISSMFEFLSFVLWCVFLIFTPIYITYSSNIKKRAMMSSDEALVQNYLVFKHLKEKNPKRLRDIIKMVRRFDPTQLD